MMLTVAVLAVAEVLALEDCTEIVSLFEPLAGEKLSQVASSVIVQVELDVISKVAELPEVLDIETVAGDTSSVLVPA